jgi:PAS domain S-box-containing protein
LRDSEERFRSAFGEAAIGMALCDGAGRFAWVNRAYCQITGYTEEELYRTSFAAIVHPEDLPRALEQVRRVVAGEIRSFLIRKRCIRKTGEVVWTQNSVLAVRDASGAVINLLALSEDVTTRKQAEDALRASEQRFRTIVETAREGIWVLDARGITTFVNPRMAEMLGWEPQDMLGRSLYEFMDAGVQAEARANPFQRNPGAREQRDLRFRRRDGAELWTIMNSSPLYDAEGNHAGTFGMLTDITRRKAAEEALRRSGQSLRALAARQQEVREEERIRIAREIHDELGQVLTGLAMDVAWLECRLPRSADDLRARLELMAQNIDGTIQSVRRIAAELRPGVLDDLGLVSAIEWQVQAFQARSGVRCSMSLPGKEIELDPGRATAVFRILQEILTNVARHAAAGSLSVELGEAHDELLLMVRDDGVGVRPERLTDSNSLGILGMRERALVFGGTVEITGLPRKGTLVCVRIPLAGRAGATEDVPPAAPKAPGRP